MNGCFMNKPKRKMLYQQFLIYISNATFCIDMYVLFKLLFSSESTNKCVCVLLIYK